MSPPACRCWSRSSSSTSNTSRCWSGRDWDEHGHLVLDPSHALETYHGRNATDIICALRVNLEGLLALPDAWIPPERKTRYREWLTRLPPLNFRERDGHRTLAPVAGEAGPIGNYEIPQLYPIFPYGIYGLGRPGLEIARDTWRHGVDPCLGPEPWTPPRPGDKPWYPARQYWYGWTQLAIWMARLGLTAEAKEYVAKKLDDARPGNEFDVPERRRLPTFWGPGFDWTPDHNWGGSGMIALQEMLLQTPGDRNPIAPGLAEGLECGLQTPCSRSDRGPLPLRGWGIAHHERGSLSPRPRRD